MVGATIGGVGRRGGVSCHEGKLVCCHTVIVYVCVWGGVSCH